MGRQLHLDPAAEKEATDIGKKFMNSTDVVGDMSRAYGADLSSVRLHTDESAARRTAERGVDAFSTGKDVFFAQGAFDKGDPASRGLLAHELSHSLQQGVGGGDTGGMGGMTQSAPMGAEQGGLISWFRDRKRRKQIQQMEISGPTDARLDQSEDSLKYMSGVREVDRKIEEKRERERQRQLRLQEDQRALDEIDALSPEELEAYAMSGQDQALSENRQRTLSGNKRPAVGSSREFAISKLLAGPNASRLLNDPAFQSIIMDQFVSKANANMKRLASSEGASREYVATVFRENTGYLGAFTALANHMLPENTNAQVIDAFTQRGITKPKKDKEDFVDRSGTISSGSYEIAGSALEEVIPQLMDQSPELQKLYARAGAAFDGVTGYDSPEARSNMLMNNFMLRSVTPALSGQIAKDDNFKEAAKAAQLYANQKFIDEDTSSFAGYLKKFFSKK